MKILARHLTADLYMCQSDIIGDRDGIEKLCREKIESFGYKILAVSGTGIAEDHYAVALLFEEGHAAVHVYAGLRYVATDIFLCREDAAPEKIFREFRNIFKPEKTRMTILKRGDFKADKDIKPKTKTKVAPLRKIHNTGAKVIRILARRNKQ